MAIPLPLQTLLNVSRDHIVSTCVFEVFLFLTMIMGDRGVSFFSEIRGQYKDVLKAGSDSATHGFVAFWSWALVEMSHFTRYKWLNCLICLGIGVGIDLDHFYAAGSLSLQAALSLPHRPPLHMSTIIPVAMAIAWVLAIVLKERYLKTLALIFFTAVFSHHVRDGSRRGLWLPTLGSTPPIPYWLYICVTMLSPLAVRAVYLYTRPSEISLNSEDEMTIVLET